MDGIRAVFDGWCRASLYYQYIAVFPPSANLRPDIWSGLWMACDQEEWYDRTMMMPRGLGVGAFEDMDFPLTATAGRDEFIAGGIGALLGDQRGEFGRIPYPDVVTYEGW